MKIIICTLICFFIGFLSHFVGKTIRDVLNTKKEELQLLDKLLNTSIGLSASLIIFNISATISKSFLIGLIATLIVYAAFIAWKFKKFIASSTTTLDFFLKNLLYNLESKYTNKYFWILIVCINIFYIATVFSTTKLERIGPGNTHTFNVNQLLNDIYPPKYAEAPNISLRFHYGADILAAILSKFAFLHPEISLDILTIIFLNLSLITIYALSIKFLDAKPINKYLIPFGAFLAWGPITYLVFTNAGEAFPKGFLQTTSYLTQSRLIDSAKWSGMVLNWFLEPSAGMGVFFFLIGLYLTSKFFTNEENIKFIILLGIFLGSLVVIDFSKLGVFLVGTLIYLIFAYSPQGVLNKFKNEKEFLIKIGVLLFTILLVGLINGNSLRISNNLVPFEEYYKLGHKSDMDDKFNLFKSNTILLLIFIGGFYLAFKQKQNWVVFLAPYFAASIILPYIITVPNQGGGKVIMNANILGAFTLPFVADYIVTQLKLKETNLKIFYVAFFFLFSFSTIMYFAFGDKEKPILTIEGNKLRYSGLQTLGETLALDETKYKDEFAFISYLKSRNTKDNSLLTEPNLQDVFSKNTALKSLTTQSSLKDLPLRKEAFQDSISDYRKSILLDPEACINKNLSWLYLTPSLFKHYMSPETRKIFLNSFLNKGISLSLGNKKINEPENMKELYEINPRSLTYKISENFHDLLENFTTSNKDVNKTPYYINQAALSPYFGIYNAKSNDFDGDKIADVAFYDPAKKIWHITFGKDFKTTSETDLNVLLMRNYKGKGLFIPIPADYDGDNKTDIALFNKIDATWHILFSSNQNLIEPNTWCSEWSEIPLPEDLDGDSKADFSCYNGNDTRWPSLLSTTKSYWNQSFNTTVADTHVYSDIDGDKTGDFVIYKPQAGTFEVYLSSCIKTPENQHCKGTQPIRVTCGTQYSRTVPADYDGDGKTDLGSWDPSTGTWEIAFSKDFLPKGSGSTQKTLTIGKAYDIPMPGDYNGDGSDEIAVYHSDTSELEILYTNGERKKINLSNYKDLIPASFIGV